jgi:hypothetical protein
MTHTVSSMNLMGCARGFMISEIKRLNEELSEKYSVPESELSDVVDRFLKDTYVQALDEAKSICGKENPVVLFIGRKDCAICQKSLPQLELFLADHKDLELVKLDYSQPEGLLYHMIYRQKEGKLPLIAFINKCHIDMIFTGECIYPEVLEQYYSICNCNSQKFECSQNLYAV